MNYILWTSRLQNVLLLAQEVKIGHQLFLKIPLWSKDTNYSKTSYYKQHDVINNIARVGIISLLGSVILDQV